MGTLFQLMITIGIFLISATNVYIGSIFSNSKVALPLMFLVIGLFAVLMFLGSLILRESPRWLMLKNKKERATKVLKRIFTSQQEVDLEIKEIEKILEESKGHTLKALFKKHFFK